MTRALARRQFRSAALAAALTLAFALPMATLARAQGVPSEALQAALEAVVDSPDTMFQGAVLAVQYPDQPLWTGAAGVVDLETRARLTPDARFRAGSIAKPFVATVVLQLVEAGAFSLDDPITAVLPATITDRFTASDRTTVRMLLDHTSGIPEWIDDSVTGLIAANPARVWDVTDFLDFAAAKPRAFDPGTSWAYSNTDFNLLGLIVEHATGNTWREEVTNRILEPLHLTHTSLPEPGNTGFDGAYMHGYGVVDGNVVDLSHIDPSMAGAAGGGALVTNTTDLITFMDALLAGSLFHDAATLDAMTTFVDASYEGGQTGYGLGLQRYDFPGGVRAIGHAGGTAGYLSFIGVFPDLGFTMAVSVDVEVDPTPVLIAALQVLAPATAQTR
ncbi:MAG: serine hydrolase [Deinococcales bacterium]|jgi:D-alanyl-D-alanine carboxypeptidase